MTQTFTTRITAFVLAAAIVWAAWVPTVTVPLASHTGALVAAVA